MKILKKYKFIIKYFTKSLLKEKNHIMDIYAPINKHFLENKKIKISFSKVLNKKEKYFLKFKFYVVHRLYSNLKSGRHHVSSNKYTKRS